MEGYDIREIYEAPYTPAPDPKIPLRDIKRWTAALNDAASDLAEASEYLRYAAPSKRTREVAYQIGPLMQVQIAIEILVAEFKAAAGESA